MGSAFILRGYGERNSEYRTHVFARGGGDRSAVAFDDIFGNGKTKARTAYFAGAGIIRAVEWIKNMLPVFLLGRRCPYPLWQRYIFTVGRRGDIDTAALHIIFYRVFDEVGEGAHKHDAVARRCEAARIDI